MTPDVTPASYPFPKVSSSMKKLLFSSILLLMLGLLTTEQQAQAQRVDLAPTLGFGFNVFNQVGEENRDFSQLSFNALYEFGMANVAFSPYVGGGIGISNTSNNTDVGLNLIGGATFGFGNLKPFAQAQITFGDIDLFTIGGGLLFSIGG